MDGNRIKKVKYLNAYGIFRLYNLGWGVKTP